MRVFAQELRPLLINDADATLDADAKTDNGARVDVQNLTDVAVTAQQAHQLSEALERKLSSHAPNDQCKLNVTSSSRCDVIVA